MSPELVEETIASLPSGRTLFPYFRDRYALQLLRNAFPRGQSVAAIKRSAFGNLLRKPTVRNLMAQIGRSHILPEDLDSAWPRHHETYRLTLGQWPVANERWARSYHQTTRRGTNLVLQLNFAVSHNRELARITGAGVEDYNESSIHPIEKKRNLTLAWSRIDLDFDTREALIEEIQSDWIRDTHRWATDPDDREQARRFRQYEDELLKPHRRIWDEAMMAATIWFLVEEIGIRSLFYHTMESGHALKQINWCHPPRSLYTDLPRQFCFQTTFNGPLFIRDHSDRPTRKLFSRPETQWFHLEFDREPVAQAA